MLFRSPRFARTARENREPEDRLSNLPVAGCSVRFPEVQGRLGRYRQLEIRQRPPGRVRPIAPAQGRAGAAEFDMGQIRQEAEGKGRGRESNGSSSPPLPRETRVPEDRLSNLLVAGRGDRA